MKETLHDSLVVAIHFAMAVFFGMVICTAAYDIVFSEAIDFGSGCIYVLANLIHEMGGVLLRKKCQYYVADMIIRIITVIMRTYCLCCAVTDLYVAVSLGLCGVGLLNKACVLLPIVLAAPLKNIYRQHKLKPERR